MVGASLGRKITFDLYVPSPVWYLVTRWVSCLSFNILPTRSSGPGDLTLGGGEYVGERCLLLLLLVALVLGGVGAREIEALRCSDPRVDLLVLSLTDLLGVGDLLGVDGLRGSLGA